MMEGHPYLIKGIPKALWKEFQTACLYFDMTAKSYLITSMSDLIVRYHRARHNEKLGQAYKLNKEKKK